MITHCLSTLGTKHFAQYAVPALCLSVLVALSASQPALAQTVSPDCKRFFQPFDTCFEQAGQLMVQGQLPQAQAIYQLADSNIDVLPPHLQAATALNLARIARWQGQYPQAQMRYAAFLRSQPSNTEAMTGLGLIAMEEKRFDDSRLYLSQAQQLGDTSEELALAQQWLSTAWKYQLTVGAQALHSPAGNSQLPVLTLEYALNAALTARVGLRALDTAQSSAQTPSSSNSLNTLSDFSSAARVLALGAVYKSKTAIGQHTVDVQYDRVYPISQPVQSQARGDDALKFSYELKNNTVQATSFYQSAHQNGLHNQELRGDIAVTLNPNWALNSAFNLVSENTQYAYQHGQLGLRYIWDNEAYVQAAARRAGTRYQQQAPSLQRHVVVLEAGIKPSKRNTLSLAHLADSLADKRQTSVAWTYEGQPRIALRHEWVQEAIAAVATRQGNTQADISVALTPMLDLKLSLNHQSLAKTTGALGVLVYRWQ
jgi:tetratricopeptide (TPR) repeat protein